MKCAIIDGDGKPTAFYDKKVHKKIPAEAVEITDEVWKTFLSDRNRWRIIDGALIEHVPTHDEIAERKKQSDGFELEKLTRDDALSLAEVLVDSGVVDKGLLPAEMKKKLDRKKELLG